MSGMLHENSGQYDLRSENLPRSSSIPYSPFISLKITSQPPHVEQSPSIEEARIELLGSTKGVRWRGAQQGKLIHTGK